MSGHFQGRGADGRAAAQVGAWRLSSPLPWGAGGKCARGGRRQLWYTHTAAPVVGSGRKCWLTEELSAGGFWSPIPEHQATVTLHGLTHFRYPKYGKITERSQICHKACFDSGICLPEYLTRSQQHSCVPLLGASVCVLRETAKRNYNFPFSCETAVPKLFRSLGHVAYHSGRQSCAVQCLQSRTAPARSWRCWARSAHPTQTVCPRGRGFGSQRHLSRAAHTARIEPAASPDEQLGDGVSQIIWGGENLPSLLGTLLCSPAVQWYCTAVPGLCPHGKGGGQQLAAVVAAGFDPLLWISGKGGG